jgi:hypothetical protein
LAAQANAPIQAAKITICDTPMIRNIGHTEDHLVASLSATITEMLSSTLFVTMVRK